MGRLRYLAEKRYMENPNTICVHPVEKEPAQHGGVTAPLFPSTAYDYLDGDLVYPGFYSTYNQKRLGKIIARLEGGQWGIAFSSGMAAITSTVLSFLEPGDHIIFSNSLYGGTRNFAEKELSKRNVRVSFAESGYEHFAGLIEAGTKAIFFETPCSPLLDILPLREIAALAKERNIITIVDNTFATPINQQPLQHGIDLVVHSGTKYLGGHSDLPYGAVVGQKPEHAKAIGLTANIMGGSLAPSLCYLAERSIKTLSLRMRQHNENGEALANFLSSQSYVKKVYFPGLASHPGHQIARTQMKGFGGMLSFELDAPANRINSFLRGLKLIRPALSLGGVESIICAPATTSHRQLSPEQRAQLGITDQLLRFSVGIEDAKDLQADLEQAFSSLH